MSWNYRIGTHIFSYTRAYANNFKLKKEKHQRLFSIIEVYYDKDGNPESYAEVNPTNSWEYIEDLIGTLSLLQEAQSKPVIDLDNWPNEWQMVLPG